MPTDGFLDATHQAPILNLDQTALLVFPGTGSSFDEGHDRKTGDDEWHRSRVVQVTIELAEETKTWKGADTIAAFFMVQHEISELIAAIIRNHPKHPLPTPAKLVQQEGPVSYRLVAELRPWLFGKTLRLVWGRERLVPSDVKWTFKFLPLK